MENSELYNEKELKQLNKTLENKYPLCLKCQVTVDSILKSQSVWLAQYKMLFFKKKPIKLILKV